ncbi:hypothetical protein E2C01_063334 [Portunus trituberculatus]|uniref:Uncharacterized protein n=1 Tax=Portunus trituberculatus TaxID=210409 RepID=A0A5B7HHA9_PORTR|nr:hypothetical protein [Portunus trituberculatus]
MITTCPRAVKGGAKGLPLATAASLWCRACVKVRRGGRGDGNQGVGSQQEGVGRLGVGDEVGVRA